MTRFVRSSPTPQGTRRLDQVTGMKTCFLHAALLLDSREEGAYGAAKCECEVQCKERLHKKEVGHIDWTGRLSKKKRKKTYLKRIKSSNEEP